MAATHVQVIPADDAVVSADRLIDEEAGELHTAAVRTPMGVITLAFTTSAKRRQFAVDLMREVAR